jgi:carbohydrate diacid regulator
MSSRIFQGIILQLKEATDRLLGVIDNTGIVVACTELGRIGENRGDAGEALSLSVEAAVTFEGYSYKALTGWSAGYDYAVFAEGEDGLAKSLCGMAAVALNGAKSFHDDKHDKSTFIKNILLDNVLPGDIYMRARELHFNCEKPRAVLLIRQVNSNEPAAVDVLQNLFPDRQHDFIISLSDSDIALIKEVSEDVDGKNLRKLAGAIEETLSSELYTKTVIGIGTPVGHLKDLAVSFKEARVAIEVGKVFDTDKSIINYESLGIGRLIYQLPTTLCEMFLSEVFKKSNIDTLDSETLYTVQKFFENSLNVSETSRKLFVHRNTLVYRLEKLKKMTGLDLREFDHAIIFKVALMVRKYLSSQNDNT